MRIFTEQGPVAGVVARSNGHFRQQHSDETDIVTADDLWIDIGAESFEEVEDQLVSLYIKNAKEKLLFGSLEEFMNLSYEESLDMVADQFGLELQTSEYFSERDTQYDPKFVANAFSSAVIDEGENSEVMEMSPEKFVVLALSDLQSERERELTEVESQIESTLKSAAAKEVIDNIAENIGL